MRVRLVPVGEIFRRMPFVVRDLARDSGKRVRLDLAGQDTEIDKFLVERMMDPVLHLVRNAISHGIETPDERIAAGKPPDGTIRLGATTAGETVVLEITDDGGGIDVAVGGARARAPAGMAVPDGPLDSRALLDIICASGFSTRDEADRASGRGVGMAVVRDTVEGLGGTLAWRRSRPGHDIQDDLAADAGDHRRDHRARRRPDLCGATDRGARGHRSGCRVAARLRAQRAAAVSRRHAADRPAVRDCSRFAPCPGRGFTPSLSAPGGRPSDCSSIGSPASGRSS